MPVHPRDWSGQLTRLVCLFALLGVGFMALAWGGPIGPPVVGWIPSVLCTFVGTLATIRLAVSVRLSPAARRFWRTMAVAIVVIAIGEVSQLWDAVGGPNGPSQLLSYRTMGCDLGGLLLIMVAFLAVPVGRMSAGAWVTFALDAGTVLAGSALFTWYFWLRTASGIVATTGSTLPLVSTVATAFLGVLVLLKISFAGVRAIDSKALQLLALAALTSSCTSSVGPLLATRSYLNTAMLAYPAAFTFLTLAVARQCRVALSGGVGAFGAPTPVPAQPHAGRFRKLHLLPYVAVALTDGLLLRTMDGPDDYRLVALGAVGLTALVVARQLVSFRENSRLLRQLDTTVGELRASENRLTFQASHDALTGLLNRTLLTDRIEAALAAPAGPADVAMALIDLDDFKQVNDRLGHIVGDTLLVAAAARVRDAIGPDDVVARLGGDEFAVLFRGLAGEPEIAARRTERILQALAGPLRIAGDELKIRASVGLADGWTGADSAELIRRADVAMYAAKGAGEGGWARFTAAMDAPAADQARLAHGLRDGLGQGDFRLVYQPIVVLPEQRISGVEALIRWHDPDRGIIPPDRFIPVAERSGLIVPLGRWVLREACRQAAEWRREYGDAAPDRVCVNVSPRQLDEADFVSDVVAALADTGLPAEHLVVEVTETAVFDGGAGAVEALHALRALGVRIALDDFGTGQSSLGLLLSCPVDILKVDKSFVDGVTEPGDRAVIVQFLSQVAHGLNLDSVAEGVEDAEQARRLHELGYRKGQGYLFSQPLPAADLAALLVAGAPATAPGGGFLPAVAPAIKDASAALIA
jgi:diguanylate cyclase (GGDEF)-like protein